MPDIKETRCIDFLCLSVYLLYGPHGAGSEEGGIRGGVGGRGEGGGGGGGDRQ